VSIHKLQLVPQPHAEIITHEPATLNFSMAIIVNREQLTDAYTDARHVSRVLHNVENSSDLDYSDLDDLCRTLHHVTEALGGMLNAKGEAAS